jgi:hypothetical protein
LSQLCSFLKALFLSCFCRFDLSIASFLEL